MTTASSPSPRSDTTATEKRTTATDNKTNNNNNNPLVTLILHVAMLRFLSRAARDGARAFSPSTVGGASPSFVYHRHAHGGVGSVRRRGTDVFKRCASVATGDDEDGEEEEEGRVGRKAGETEGSGDRRTEAYHGIMFSSESEAETKPSSSHKKVSYPPLSVWDIDVHADDDEEDDADDGIDQTVPNFETTHAPPSTRETAAPPPAVTTTPPPRRRRIPPPVPEHDHDHHDNSRYGSSSSSAGCFDEPDLGSPVDGVSPEFRGYDDPSPSLPPTRTRRRSVSAAGSPPPIDVPEPRRVGNPRIGGTRSAVVGAGRTSPPPYHSTRRSTGGRPTKEEEEEEEAGSVSEEKDSVAAFLEKNRPREEDVTIAARPDPFAPSVDTSPVSPPPDPSPPPPSPPPAAKTKIKNDYWNHDPAALRTHLLSLHAALQTLNGGKPLNANSPRQVSTALFGNPDEPTDRDTLEGLAEGGGRGDEEGRRKAETARLVLESRKLGRYLGKVEREARNRESGRYATNIVGPDRPGVDPPSAPSSSPASATATKREEGNVAEEKGDDNPRKDPLVLIDTSAYVFRAYYSMPPLHRADGEPVGALLGVCNMLNRLLLTPLLHLRHHPTTSPPLRVILVFDSKNAATHRKILYPPYKANRKPCPEDLKPQFEFCKKAAEAYGIPALEADGYEADDVIATLATLGREEGWDVNVVSGDKDLLQLVTKDYEEEGGEDGDGDVGGGEGRKRRPSVHVIDPATTERHDYDSVLEKWGVPPSRLGDVLALAGDAADNVPGVPGVGKKTAAALIGEYGSLDVLLERAGEIPQKRRRENVLEFAETARLSRRLVELERGITFEEMSMPEEIGSVGDITVERLDEGRLLGFYEEMGLRDLKRRTEERFDAARAGVETQVVDGVGGGDGVAGRYASILDGDAGSNGGGVGHEARNMGREARQDVVAEAARGAVAAASESKSVSKGMPSFYSPRRYDKPPDPEQFKDVPF